MKMLFWITFAFLLLPKAASAETVTWDLLKSIPPFRKEQSLPDLMPDFIVLDFWASWCAPCEEAVPFLMSQKKKWKEQNVLWIGVNQDQSAESAEKFLKRTSYDFLQLRDQDKKLALKMKIDTLPRLYVLNSKSEVIWSHFGFNPRDRAAIEKKFQELFQKP